MYWADIKNPILKWIKEMDIQITKRNNDAINICNENCILCKKHDEILAWHQRLLLLEHLIHIKINFIGRSTDATRQWIYENKLGTAVKNHILWTHYHCVWLPVCC